MSTSTLRTSLRNSTQPRPSSATLLKNKHSSLPPCRNSPSLGTKTSSMLKVLQPLRRDLLHLKQILWLHCVEVYDPIPLCFPEHQRLKRRKDCPSVRIHRTRDLEHYIECLQSSLLPARERHTIQSNHSAANPDR